MSNYPEGAAHDPRALFNQEDEGTFVKCHICGNGGVAVDNGMEYYKIECGECGAIAENGNLFSCEVAFENGDYDNISYCRYCHRETEGLTIQKNLNSVWGLIYHVVCECGVSARYCETEREALEAWEELK